MTMFIQEMCLFEIVEIIVLNNTQVVIVGKQIKLNGFHSHFEAYEVDKNTQVILNPVFIQLNHFNGPPITLINTPIGNKMFRIKEYFI